MRLRGKGVPPAVLGAMWGSLSEAQRDRIRAKQQWEMCSQLAVLRDWPELWDPESSC